jgi:hypothetical protein
MPARPSISEHLARRSVVPMESTIPPDMTIAQWRRLRSSRARTKRLPSATALPPMSCNHVHESTTRYDHDQKALTFLLLCPVCGTERIMETQRYEPRFEPGPGLQLADASGLATIHPLPVRKRKRPLHRAA